MSLPQYLRGARLRMLRVLVRVGLGLNFLLTNTDFASTPSCVQHAIGNEHTYSMHLCTTHIRRQRVLMCFQRINGFALGRWHVVPGTVLGHRARSDRKSMALPI